jgi:hypothetical protein
MSENDENPLLPLRDQPPDPAAEGEAPTPERDSLPEMETPPVDQNLAQNQPASASGDAAPVGGHPGHPPGHKCPWCSLARRAAAQGVTASELKAASTKAAKQARRAPPPVAKKTPPLVQHKATPKEAVETRWQRDREARFDWDGCSLEDGEAHLGWLRRELEQGAKTIQYRFATDKQPFVPCEICHKEIPNGRWMQMLNLRNPESGVLHQVFLCSSTCITKYNLKRQGLTPSGQPLAAFPSKAGGS